VDRQEVEALVEALIEEARQRTRRRRRRYGAVAALAALAGVAVFTGFERPAQSQSASSAFAASTSGALKGKVRVEVRGTNQTNGRVAISGAISDRGRYVDSGGRISSRKLIGAKGTIWFAIGFPKTSPCQCNWRITKGTGAYAGLRGRGQEEGMYEGSFQDTNGVVGYTPTTHLTMTGTVWR
jgi:hypothetical protein